MSERGIGKAYWNASKVNWENLLILKVKDQANRLICTIGTYNYTQTGKHEFLECIVTMCEWCSYRMFPRCECCTYSTFGKIICVYSTGSMSTH